MIKQFALVLFVLVIVSNAIHLPDFGNIFDTNDKIKTFHIALQQNQVGIKQLEKYIYEISDINSKNYGKYLTIAEIDNFVNTSAEIKQNVKEWLFDNGIYNCIFYSDFVKCTEKISLIDKVFKTETKLFFQTEEPFNIILTSEKAYELPNIKGIEFIDGLSNSINQFNKIGQHHFQKIGDIVDTGIITREVIMRVYNMYPNFVLTNVSVGAIEFTGATGFSNQNLMTSQLANGVYKNPVSENCLIGTDSYSDGESQLDMQMLFLGCPNCYLCYEITTAWIYSWLSDFYNRKFIPEVISISWGWSAKEQCSITHNCNNITTKQYVERCDVEFMKVAARGTTVVISSGDAGVPGRTNEQCISQPDNYGWTNINPIYPSSSPWVLSVGATFLVNSSAQYNYSTPICKDFSCSNSSIEHGTSFNEVGWTSGAGANLWSKTPLWQYDVVQQYINSGIQLPNKTFWNTNGRMYPDISAFGHNCAIYDQGWTSEDGTSCSAPLVSGIIANLNSYQKSQGKPILGFINPLLYKMAKEMPSTINDILVGNTCCTEVMCCGSDFGFIASKGYDIATGLGSINVNQVKKYLDGIN
jgi:subtilase family serine protease